MISKPQNTAQQNRAALDESMPSRLTPAIIREIEMTAEDTVRLTFTTRVYRSRVPLFKAGDNETVETATPISDTEVELTFSGPVADSEMRVPEGDAGLRTPAGGFVPAGVYDLPEFQQAA